MTDGDTAVDTGVRSRRRVRAGVVLAALAVLALVWPVMSLLR